MRCCKTADAAQLTKSQDFRGRSLFALTSQRSFVFVTLCFATCRVPRFAIALLDAVVKRGGALRYLRGCKNPKITLLRVHVSRQGCKDKAPKADRVLLVDTVYVHCIELH